MIEESFIYVRSLTLDNSYMDIDMVKFRVYYLLEDNPSTLGYLVEDILHSML